MTTDRKWSPGRKGEEEAGRALGGGGEEGGEEGGGGGGGGGRRRGRQSREAWPENGEEEALWKSREADACYL